MKRALLAILILATGTTVFCALHSATIKTRQNIAARAAAWQSQTQQIFGLHFEKQQVIERIEETRRTLAVGHSQRGPDELAREIVSGVALTNLTAAESERLLAELGFNWNSTGDYLIVSKRSLDGISFEALKGMKSTSAGRGVLAMTHSEQTEIEAVARRFSEARAAWVKENVQRTEPSGNVLAQYLLPAADRNFSQSQMAAFTSSILGILGQERAHWLQKHSTQWMMDVGLRVGLDISNIPPELLAMLPEQAMQARPTTLTLERYESGGQSTINYTLKQAGNTMTTSVNPWQPFPEAFRALFPDGWKDLAAREGFELPEAFRKQK